MASDRDVVVRARWPTYSRTARWIAILALPWFFGILLATDAMKITGPEGRPELRIPVLVVACAPGVFAVLVRWLGRLPGFRWTHHPQQPQLTVGEDGLALQLPGKGVGAYGWDEIHGLRPRPNGGADVLGAGGVVLARLPDSLVVAKDTWLRAESTAALIARSQPQRFRLSGANWVGEPNELSRRAADDPPGPDPTWAARRMIVNVGIGLSALAIIVAYFAIALAQR